MTDGSEGGGQLPVAGAPDVRRATLSLIGRDKRAFVAMIALNALATAAGLTGPWLLGDIINTVKVGGHLGRIDRLALAMLVFALLQLVLTRYARYVGARFGERTSARIREQFIDRVLQLPASATDRIATGDLVTRGTGDVTTVASTMREAAPDVLIAAIQALFIIVAVLVINPLLGVCGVVALLGVSFITRWYLARARGAYLAYGAANSVLAETLTATAAGARTVDALRLEAKRIGATDDAIEDCRERFMRTLSLRTVLFPVIDVCYVLPLVGVLLVGGALYDRSAISLGAVIASALYLRQLSAPLDALSLWVDQLQSCGASFARLEGLNRVNRPGPSGPVAPTDDRIVLNNVHYAYQDRNDVLHGIDLRVRQGERLAIVGPSGAGKSTLARLLAGIDEPRIGSVTVGGVAVSDLSPEQLRQRIVLVTQEHHVFLDSLRQNLLLAKPSATDAELWAALAAVGADWAKELPEGLDRELGPSAYRVGDVEAQQVALSRVVLADPHTVVLDEATARLAPTTARSTERALWDVLAGRTVVSIAHRLHTAHDADRVVVMEEGTISELGTHDELLASGGAYSNLWRSWHGERPPEDRRAL